MRRTRGTINTRRVSHYTSTPTQPCLDRSYTTYPTTYYVYKSFDIYQGMWVNMTLVTGMGHTFFGIRELRWIRNLTMQKWSKNTSTYLQIWTSIRRLSKKFTIYLRFDFDGQGGRKETRNILFHLPSEF